MNYLLLNQNKQISVQEIFNHVLKNETDVEEGIVWVYISYLRQKLTSIQSQVRIEGDQEIGFTLIK